MRNESSIVGVALEAQLLDQPFLKFLKLIIALWFLPLTSSYRRIENTILKKLTDQESDEK